MTTFISNRNSNGKTDENGHFRLPLKMLDGQIFSGFNVSQTKTPSMQIVISKGELKIPYDDYSYAGWSDEDITIDIPTASSSNNRIDRIVAYVDRTKTYKETDINNPGCLVIKDVPGTPANPASAPTDTQVQNSVGAGNPWINLATIWVGLGVTAIYSNNIDTSSQTHTALSSNVSVSSVTGKDGKKFKFMVLPESQENNLPSPEKNTTIVVFITKGN